jgi:3-hydroxybutyryl-CoA dehydratase
MLKYEDIKVGDVAEVSKTISEYDVYAFAGITGDFNPVHVNDEFAKDSIFKYRIAHGMLTASFISTVLGTKLPAENTIYLSQNLKFTFPVYFGDTITAKVEVIEKIDEKRIIKLRTTVCNQRGTTVVDGDAVVIKK